MPRREPLGKKKPHKKKPLAQDPVEELLKGLVDLVVEEHEPPPCYPIDPDPPSGAPSAPSNTSQVQTRSMEPLQSEEYR